MMGFKWQRGPSAAALVDELLRALAYAEARATDTLPELGAEPESATAAVARGRQPESHRPRASRPAR